MEKLIEMANAGVELNIFGPYQYRAEWSVNATKTDTEGTRLEIKYSGDNLLATIDEVYDRWIRATRNGMPSLTLNQIEHQPPAPYHEIKRDIDDEIPF